MRPPWPSCWKLQISPPALFLYYHNLSTWSQSPCNGLCALLFNFVYCLPPQLNINPETGITVLSLSTAICPAPILIFSRYSGNICIMNEWTLNKQVIYVTPTYNNYMNISLQTWQVLWKISTEYWRVRGWQSGNICLAKWCLNWILKDKWMLVRKGRERKSEEERSVPSRETACTKALRKKGGQYP